MYTLSITLAVGYFLFLMFGIAIMFFLLGLLFGKMKGWLIEGNPSLQDREEAEYLSNKRGEWAADFDEAKIYHP